MPQTTVTGDPPVGLEGAISYPLKTYIDPNTRFVSQPGGIPFGKFVVRTAEQQVRLPAADGDITNAKVGISVRQPYHEYNGQGYADGEPITVVFTGYVWMYVESAAIEGAQVYARTAAGGRGQGSALAAGAAAAAVQGATFDHSTSAAGLVIVRLRG